MCCDSLIINRTIPERYSIVRNSKEHGLVRENRSFPDIFSGKYVVVESCLSGICRSDIKELQGLRKKRSYFGHEMIGKIVIPGPLTELSHGDYVTFNPNILIKRNIGFSNYTIAEGSTIALNNAFPVIDFSISEKKAIFFEPLACAYRCISNMLIEKKDIRNLQVAIVGAGIAGSLINMLCEYFGCNTVIFNRSHPRLDFFKKKNLKEPNKLKLIGSGQDLLFDIVIIATTFSYQEILNFASNIVKDKGMIMLYGSTNKGDIFLDTQIDIDQVRNMEEKATVMIGGKIINISGSYGADLDNFKNAFNLLRYNSKYFPVEQLICREVSFKELLPTLSSLNKETSVECGKIIVKYKK